MSDTEKNGSYSEAVNNLYLPDDDETVYDFEGDKKAERKSKAVKILTVIIVVVIIALAAVISFWLGTRNGNKDGNIQVSEDNATTSEYETRIETVTNENGEPVTDENGNAVTQVVIVEPTTEAQAYRTGDYIVTGTNELRLRETPSTDSQHLTTIPANARITVSEIYENPEAVAEELRYWGKTSYNGWTGWIALGYTEYAYNESVDVPTSEYTTQEETTVTVGNYSSGKYSVTYESGIKLRKDHSTSAESIMLVPYGTILTVKDIYCNTASTAEDTKYWGKVTYSGWEGWVALYYTQPSYGESVVTGLPEEVSTEEVTTIATHAIIDYVSGTYVVNPSNDYPLSIRQSHTVDSERVGQIPAGATITISEVYEDVTAQSSLRFWGKVTYNNYTGWVSMFYLLATD